MRGQLKRAGFETIGAKNAVEAITLAQRETPDLILMDVMMPGMTGLEAVRQLKGIETTRGIPVVIMSANYHPTLKHEADSAGAADLITKPLNVAKLLDLIRSQI